jgi:hypothetical protein
VKSRQRTPTRILSWLQPLAEGQEAGWSAVDNESKVRTHKPNELVPPQHQ